MSHDWLTSIRMHLLRKALILYDVPPPSKADFEDEAYEEWRRIAYEGMYQDWCLTYLRDPESTYTAVEFDEWFNQLGIEYDE